MAQLLSGTRIYGTATVDTQLFVNGIETASSTNTGALQVAGGVGVGGTLFVGSSTTIVGQTSITNTTNAVNSTTGALTVAGGLGVQQDLRVGGTIYGLVNGTVIGIITTATSLEAGTRGQVPFQIDPGVTGFFGPGTAGQLLVSAGASATGPVFTNTGSIYVGRAGLADDLSGGAPGDLPYQTANNDTTFLGIGSSGTILTSTGSAPQWASTGSLVVGRAGQSDTILLTNDTASSDSQFITFVSTTTGYTSLKGSAVTNLTFRPNLGYLGIGSSNPQYKLDIVESADAVPVRIERATGGNIVQLYNSSGLTTARNGLAFLHKDSVNAAVTGSKIEGYVTSLASGAVSGGLSITVKNAGVESEAVIVDNLGNFGLGTTPAHRLDVSGGARISGITTVTNATSSTTPTTGALQVTGGVGIGGNINSAGQITSTRSNNTATGAAQIYLNGASGNRIDFAPTGLGAPTLSTRSVGTKIVLYPNLSISTTDYAFGAETGALWSSISSGADSFIWYAANTNIASLNGSGNLVLAGDLAVNGGDITSSQSSFNLLASGVTNLTFGTAATSITIGNNSAGTTTVRNILAVTTNTNSTAISNGALVVTGGVGIAQDLRVGGTIFGNVSVTGIISTATNLAGGTLGQVPYQTAPGQTSFFGPGTAGDVLVSNGAAAPSYNNTLALAGTTPSTNATSGALRVAGGTGIQGDLHVGSSINGQTFIATGSSPAANTTVNFGVSSSGAWINSPTGTTANLAVAGTGVLSWSGTEVIVSPTTAASSTATGALQVRGGVGIGGDAVVGGDLQIQGGDLTTNQTTFNLVDTTATTVNFARAGTSIVIGAASGSTNVRNNLIVGGNLTVQGTTTQVNSTVTNVSDPIFTIGTGPNGSDPTADDNKDRGIAFKWHNGTTARTGFFGYDDSTGFFTFLTSATFVNEIVAPAGGTSRGALDVNLALGATGSIPYQASPSVTTFLPIGTNGQVLISQGGIPVWTAPSGITAGNANTVEMTNDVASTAPQFITFVGTATGAAAVKASAMSGLTFIPSSSRLGIGINTPTYPLHINVPSGIASIGLSGTAANAQTMKLMQGVTGVGNGGFSIYDDSNSATRFMIGSTGNVGIGTGTQDPTDRLHVSNSGGTASLRVGDTASTQAGIILQRRNGGVDAQSHWFNSNTNSPWYLYGENLLWTGERAGTVTATHAFRPYYEAFSPSVGYAEFGFVNVTTGAFSTANLIPNIVLKNDGTVGVGTKTPTRTLHVVSSSWDNVTGGGAIFENSNAIGSGITLKPSASVVTNGSSGWAVYAGGPSAAIGDGNLGFWAHGDNQSRVTVTRAGDVGIGTGGAPTFTNGTGIEVQRSGTATLRLDSNTFATELRGLADGTHLYQLSAGYLDLGTNNTTRVRVAGDGKVGIGTLSPNVTLDVRGVIQGQSYAMAATGATAQWVKLGTLTAPQSGYTARIRTYLHTGYTAQNTQDFYVDIFFKTSNGTSVDPNGFAGNSWYYSTGFNSHDVTPVWVGNAVGVSATSYDLYLNLPSYTNNSHYVVEIVEGTTWVHSGTIGVAAPGAASATTATSTLGYNIPIGRVGIGTVSPISTLDVNGTARITGLTTVTNNTQASSTITGALVVTGGVGIGGNLFVGGTINGTFIGSISGVASTASNVIVTNDTSTAVAQYITFVDATGNRPIKIDNAELSFVPSTGRLGVGTNAPGYKLDVRGDIYTSGTDMWFGGATTGLHSSATFNFLTSASAAQSGKFKSVQVSTSYTGTLPDDGILFGTDSTLYRSAATRLRTNSGFVVDGNLGVNDTAPDVRLSVLQNADVWHARFGATATTKQFRIGGNTTNGVVLGAYNTGDNTSPTNLLLQRDGGQVVIGSATPFATSTVPLYVKGGASGWSVFERNSKRIYINPNFSDGNAAAQISSEATSNMALSLSARETLADLYLTTTGRIGMGTAAPVTNVDIRANNASTQASQVAGLTLRTNENNGMEWHLQHTNGYQGWVAAARVNNNGASWGQAYLEFITAGASGGNQTSVMALHGNGNVSIGSTAAPAYKLFVNGSFAATTKSFVIDHPIKAGWKLRYASLEGPENGVYIRGRLKEDNVIKLPDYWRELVDIDSITVDITPVGKYQKLYVQEIKPNYIVIATESDMGVNCFYTVWAERKDVGKLVVEYEG